MEKITLNTNRDGYTPEQCGNTLTVAELISYLSQWDDDTPVYYSNDNGYTYGAISFEDIDSIIDEEEEDE